MPNIIYYVPNLKGRPTMEQVDDLGLGHAFDRRPEFNAITGATGPDGRTTGGTIARNTEQIHFLPEQQSWVKDWGSKHGIGVGCFRDDPPGPDDLYRDNQVPGFYKIELGDGNTWRCPIAREWKDDGTHESVLPRTMTREPDGIWKPGQPDPRYKWLWRIAEEFSDWYRKTDEDSSRATIDDNWIFSRAAACLRANYHVSDAECELLGLLTPQIAVSILEALIDAPQLVAWIATQREQKKTSSTGDGKMPSAGQEDLTKTTGPPSQTASP